MIQKHDTGRHPAPGRGDAARHAATRHPAPGGPGAYPELHPARRNAAESETQTLVFLHGGNVGNWSWDPQVLAFGDFNVMTLHLPSFGARAQEPWQGLESAADDVAAVIADEVSTGGVHLVGMSLGGVIALHVAARHPELVQSLLVTGTPVAGVPAAARALNRVQLKLLGSEWYWRFQAGAHGMIDDDRELFASHGLQLKAANMRAIKDELEPGGLPSNLTGFKAPVLVLAGAREPKVVQRSFEPLQTLLPQASTRLVPGMHHQWNIEDPVFFNTVVRRWVLDGAVHDRLVDPAQAKPRLRGRDGRPAASPDAQSGPPATSTTTAPDAAAVPVATKTVATKTGATKTAATPPPAGRKAVADTSPAEARDTMGPKGTAKAAPEAGTPTQEGAADDTRA